MALPVHDLAQTLSSPCSWHTIYLFPWKKTGSRSVILSSHFPHSIAFHSDFQRVIEKKRPLGVWPSCTVCLVVKGVGEQRGKMGFILCVAKQEGWIQLAEHRV